MTPISHLKLRTVAGTLQPDVVVLEEPMVKGGVFWFWLEGVEDAADDVADCFADGFGYGGADAFSDCCAGGFGYG